ncbi:hypothetical protein [Arthrobacter celericrescens]|uniref:hypothetical protein n=1 Tax=Arthrobacter celericrescens TaxID=2320851 RepID=UPI000EA10BD9|nr:hypothetical protein [Arthrobacter celericrescens]
MPENRGTPSYAAAELRAREHRARHEFAQAADSAHKAADTARDDGDISGWWNMVFFQAENLLDAGESGGAADLARTLVEAPPTVASSRDRARALILLANSVQGSGLLDDAAEAARSAVGLLADDADAEFEVHARQALIAALAESGKLDEAWEESLALSARISDDMDDQLAGKAYWVIGNVAFLCNKVEEGLEHHELAADTFSPASNLDVWARFNKASAAMRLAAGVADSGTLRCIERAELATDIVGGSEEEILLLRYVRAHWNFLAGDAPAAIALLTEVTGSADKLPPQTAGEAYLLLARAEASDGRRQAAELSQKQSVEYFEKAGAHQRAVQAGAVLSGGTDTAKP